MRLRKCLFAAEMLLYLSAKDVGLEATTKELSLPPTGTDVGSFEESIDFLAPFHNLKDLFLMFESLYIDSYYGEMIQRHQDTLRRLIYQRRNYCIDEASPYFEEYNDVSLGSPGFEWLIEIILQSQLKIAGICVAPSVLQKGFQHTTSSPNCLKLLHLRFTGKASRKPRFFVEKKFLKFMIPPSEESSTSPNSDGDDDDDDDEDSENMSHFPSVSSLSNNRSEKFEKRYSKKWQDEED